MDNLDDIIKLIDSEKNEKSQNILLKYLKRWPWFLVSCMIGLFAGYFIYKNSPEKYEVTSRLLVKSEEADMNQILAFNNYRQDTRYGSNIEKQIGILQSYTLYRKALENLGWDYSWYQKRLLYDADFFGNEPFETIIPPNAINATDCIIEVSMLDEAQYSINVTGVTSLNGYPQNIDISDNLKFGDPFVNDFFNFSLMPGIAVPGETYILQFNNLDALTRAYLNKTKINSEQDKSDIITIKITGNVRQKEADFINELTNVFINFGMENRFAKSQSSEEFIDSQLERLKNTLKDSEDKFSNYRRNNQTVNLGQEAQTIYSRLEEIEQEQYLTQLQFDYYQDLLLYLGDAKRIEQMVNPSVIGITDSNLTGMLSKLLELYSRREVLSYSVQDNNPAIKVQEKEIQVLRNGLEEAVKGQLTGTRSKMESLQQRHEEIQARLRRLPDTEKNLINIQREFELNNEIYTYMLQKKTETSISKASVVPEIQVIDEAFVEASEKIGPKFIINIAAGLLGGGSIPFIIVTLLILFNNKIETTREVERGIKIPVLEGIMKHKFKSQMPVVDYPRSGIAESFRGLRTNINTMVNKNETKIISVNSLIPGEGKSFISVNLAAALSISGKKVLLIGADLHKPTLHKFLKVNVSSGLSEYINEGKNLDEIISATTIPDLYFIQAGHNMKNSSKLLDETKFTTLMEKTSELFDYIVIENAPIMLVPETVMTSHFADITLFILRLNYSHKQQIRQIQKIIDFNKIKSAAVVMNDVYDKGYGYGYAKKYWEKGYGELKR